MTLNRDASKSLFRTMKVHTHEFSLCWFYFMRRFDTIVFYLQVAEFQELPQDFQGTSRANELYKYEILHAITTL